MVDPIKFSFDEMYNCCGIALVCGVSSGGYVYEGNKSVHKPYKDHDWTADQVADFTRRAQEEACRDSDDDWGDDDDESDDDGPSYGLIQMNLIHQTKKDIELWCKNGWIVMAECQSNHGHYPITSLGYITRPYKAA